MISAEEGESITFSEVLLVVDGDSRKIGTPLVEGASVTGKIIKDVKGKKVISFKFRRRKASQVKKGHRQPITVVRIESI